MALYRVVRADGSVVEVEAASKSEASQKVRYAGEKIQSVTEVKVTTPKPPTTPTTPPPITEPTPTPTKPLTPEDWAKAKEKVAQYTPEQQLDYIQYKQFLKTDAGRTWPDPTSIADFLSNVDKWAGEMSEIVAGEENEQLRQYNLYLQYMRAYGEIGDWRPTSFEDWLDNQDIVNQQLDQWRQAGAAVDEYALPPEEAARRREEGYAESRYAAKERYREQPMYQETFTQWMEGQSGVSSALQSYIESEYPSLRSEFEAGIGRLGGFPTREAARGEATRRESSWQAWLGERLPETEQEYYMQRPYARGERYRDYSPTLRAVNW